LRLDGSDLNQDKRDDLTDVLDTPASVRITAFIADGFQHYIDLPQEMNALLNSEALYEVVNVCQSTEIATGSLESG
jgi:hypothetical protein